MSKAIQIPFFTGLFTSLDGQAPKGFCQDMMNAHVLTGSVKFRPGFIPKRTRPTSFEKNLGFQFVRAFSDTSSVAEVISIEKRAGAVRPYSFWAGTTTEILNGASSVDLEEVNHSVVPFFGKAYVLAPGAEKSLYSHEIGNLADFSPVQDSAYVPPPGDPAFTITTGETLLSRSWAPSTTDTYTYPIWDHTHIDSSIQVTIGTGEFDGYATFKGGNDDDGPNGGQLQIQCVYAAAQDFSGAEYLHFTVEGLNDMRVLFAATVMPEIRVGGVWLASLEGRWYQDGLKGTFICYLRGLSVTAVEGFRFSVFYDPQRSASTPAAPRDFLRVSPVKLGGTYVESTVGTQRIWDTSLIGNGVTYGVRFSNSSGSTVSSIIQSTITAEQGWGAYASIYSKQVGGLIQLSSTTAPTTPYDRAQFLRLDASGTFRVLATVVAGAGVNFTHVDTSREMDLAALPSAGSGSPPEVRPPFTTVGLLSASRYKGFMCWCFKGVKTNIRYSRVLSENHPNAAEELYSSSVAYDPEDLTQPASYTLSEGGDEAIGVVSDDDVLYFFGRLGVYVQAGDYPSTMTPTVPVPDANPVAGPRAFCLFPPTESRSGVAYLDDQGSIWYVSARRSGTNNVLTSEPVEISKDIRGFIRRVLLDEQRSEFGYTDFSQAILHYSQMDNTLRVMLGDREVVYRPRHLQTGDRFWEANEYNLRHISPSVVSLCTPWGSTGYSPGSVLPGDATWSLVSNSLVPDDVYALATIPAGTSKKTEVLRFSGFVPPSVIPLGSTLTSMKFRVEASKTGDLDVTHTMAQPKKSGANIGANLATNRVLTSSDVVETFTLGTLPTLAELNAGAMGIDTQFSQEDWDTTNYNNPANWTITVTPSGLVGYTVDTPSTQATVFTITATYIGPGAAPSKVWVSVTGTNGASISDYSGTGVTALARCDTGLDSETEFSLDGTNIADELTATKKVKIGLSGGTGSTTVTMETEITSTFSLADVVIEHEIDSATLVAPTPATVKVDSSQVEVCYTTPVSGDPGPTSVQGITTADKGSCLWARSSGEIDELAWDSANSRFIEGANRDGGYVAPSGFVTMGGIQGSGIFRLNYVTPQMGEFGEPVTVTAISDRLSTWQGSTKYGENYRFGVNLTGRELTPKIGFSESLSSIVSLNIDVIPLSNQRTK